MDDLNSDGLPASGKTAEEILKSKAKIERARLKRVAARGAAKTVKPKVKPAKKTKTKTKTKKAKKAKPAAAACVRSERLDMRLSKAEKAKVQAKAKKLRRTITSVVLEAVEKIKS